MTTPAPDFRELCAELVKWLDELNCNFDIPSQSALIECALDALAAPPPEPPTDKEIKGWAATTLGAPQGNPGPFGWGWRCFSEELFTCTIRAALERWGHR
jgi:hypothetical protein